MKFLIPNWIQFLWHGARSLFHFANLYGNIWIARSAFILCDKALRANYCKHTRIYKNNFMGKYIIMNNEYMKTQQV